jgi:hypothetical protein
MAECRSGKACHRSERAAHEAAIAVGRKRTHSRLRVYFCSLCRYWHLTSRPGTSRLERRRHRLIVRVPTPATPEEVAAFFAKYGPRQTMVT